MASPLPPLPAIPVPGAGIGGAMAGIASGLASFAQGQRQRQVDDQEVAWRKLTLLLQLAERAPGFAQNPSAQQTVRALARQAKIPGAESLDLSTVAQDPLMKTLQDAGNLSFLMQVPQDQRDPIAQVWAGGHATPQQLAWVRSFPHQALSPQTAPAMAQKLLAELTQKGTPAQLRPALIAQLDALGQQYPGLVSPDTLTAAREASASLIDQDLTDAAAKSQKLAAATALDRARVSELFRRGEYEQAGALLRSVQAKLAPALAEATVGVKGAQADLDRARVALTKASEQLVRLKVEYGSGKRMTPAEAVKAQTNMLTYLAKLRQLEATTGSNPEIDLMKQTAWGILMGLPAAARGPFTDPNAPRAPGDSVPTPKLKPLHEIIPGLD